MSSCASSISTISGSPSTIYESPSIPTLKQGNIRCTCETGLIHDDLFPWFQAMIRNRCENFGDGRCEESRNIKVLEEYLHSHGVKSETYARPGRPERPNLLCESLVKFWIYRILQRIILATSMIMSVSDTHVIFNCAYCCLLSPVMFD